MFYRIYPDDVADTRWIEVALHEEAAAPLDAGDAHRRGSEERLRRAGDALVERLRDWTTFRLDVTPPYYSLHPPGLGEAGGARMSLTLSLVFSAVDDTEFRKIVRAELDRMTSPALAGTQSCPSRSTRRRTQSSVRERPGPASAC